ncbi:MAG: hypothetical protein KG012_18080 [Deltaproteobacteria bacterium]|nr:hypothetical protein [Deltaproteobacteria bacterium]
MSSDDGKVVWGTAAPAGMCALSTGIMGLFALLMGWVPPESLPLLIAWLFVCSLAQVIAAIIEYRRGDTAFAFCLLFFGIVLQGGTALMFLVRTWALSSGMGQLPPYVDGWIWLGFTISIATIIPAMLRISWSVVAIIIWVDIAALLFALLNLGVIGAELTPLIAIMFLVFGLYMFYAAMAVMTNTVYQKQVFPLGGPLIKS